MPQLLPLEYQGDDVKTKSTKEIRKEAKDELKETDRDARPGLILGLGRSPGEGKGYPLQYSGLENSMDSIVYGVAKCQTQLSGFHFTLAE